MYGPSIFTTKYCTPREQSSTSNLIAAMTLVSTLTCARQTQTSSNHQFLNTQYMISKQWGGGQVGEDHLYNRARWLTLIAQ